MKRKGGNSKSRIKCTKIKRSSCSKFGKFTYPIIIVIGATFYRPKKKTINKKTKKIFTIPK